MIDKSIQLDNRKFTVGTFDDSDKLLHAVDTLREKGVKMEIATYLGASCSGGDFTNSAGSYLIDEITWP